MDIKLKTRPKGDEVGEVEVTNVAVEEICGMVSAGEENVSLIG